MQELQPEDLRRSVAAALQTLGTYLGGDWSGPAGDLEWSCRRTLAHMIDALLWYAANLATTSTSRRGDVREVDPAAPIDAMLDSLESAGHILARVAEASPPGARGFHGAGMADATGFLAMGCDETLVHANDIAAGLGAGFDPPTGVPDRVVARLFPWAPEHGEPWERLLWCNGRTTLPGLDRLGSEWGWWCAPLDEWDGIAYTDRWPGD